MVRYGQLDLDTCLVKIMVEIYMQQKTYNKMFGSCEVMFASQSVFYLEIY